MGTGTSSDGKCYGISARTTIGMSAVNSSTGTTIPKVPAAGSECGAGVGESSGRESTNGIGTGERSYEVGDNNR